MPDATLSSDLDAFVTSANDAAARTELGLTALATTTPGTGVATALAINTGSAGAFLPNNAANPPSNDGAALGTTLLNWSDLFLASGAVVNWANGDVLLTHAANALTFTGASIYQFDSTVRPTADDAAALGAATASWADLFLASGAVINFNNGNLGLTHNNAGAFLLVNPGDLRITSANVGTNADSVPTLSSTSTLTNKTLASPTLTGTTTAGTVNADSGTVGALNFSRTLAADDTYHGTGITGINSGYTNAQWDAVYYDFTAGEWLAADANGSGTYPAQGLAVTASTDGAALTVMTQGIVRNDAWNWVAGPIYLSATAAGLTQTAPSTSGDKVQVVGFAISADVAYFNFNTTYLTVA